MSGDLDSERIGDRPSSALFIFDPCGVRECNRNRSALDQKLNIDRIGVTRRDGNDQRLVDAVNRLPGPAVDDSEVFKHDYKTIAEGMGREQMAGDQEFLKRSSSQSGSGLGRNASRMSSRAGREDRDCPH